MIEDYNHIVYGFQHLISHNIGILPVRKIQAEARHLPEWLCADRWKKDRLLNQQPHRRREKHIKWTTAESAANNIRPSVSIRCCKTRTSTKCGQCSQNDTRAQQQAQCADVGGYTAPQRQIEARNLTGGTSTNAIASQLVLMASRAAASM